MTDRNLPSAVSLPKFLKLVGLDQAEGSLQELNPRLGVLEPSLGGVLELEVSEYLNLHPLPPSVCISRMLEWS